VVMVALGTNFNRPQQPFQFCLHANSCSCCFFRFVFTQFCLQFIDTSRFSTSLLIFVSNLLVWLKTYIFVFSHFGACACHSVLYFTHYPPILHFHHLVSSSCCVLVSVSVSNQICSCVLLLLGFCSMEIQLLIGFFRIPIGFDQ